jgi:hypothetical protein
MKLEARQVRFQVASTWFARHRQRRFVGNRNTLQLLETALVIEGYRMRFFFPLLDSFFRQALSEWTTITVPYSRIVRFKHSTRLLLRIVVTSVSWFPFGLLLVLVFLAAGQEGWAKISAGASYVFGVFAVLALLLTVYCQFRLAPRNYLWYREADGRPTLLVFRIRSRPLQQAFERQLEGYRQAARERGAGPGLKDKEGRS